MYSRRFLEICSDSPACQAMPEGLKAVLEDNPGMRKNPNIYRPQDHFVRLGGHYPTQLPPALSLPILRAPYSIYAAWYEAQ